MLALSLPRCLFTASNLILHDKWRYVANSMNESSLPSPPAQSRLPLGSLQKILHNRIVQKKEEIHKSHNRAYTDSLWT